MPDLLDEDTINFRNEVVSRLNIGEQRMSKFDSNLQELRAELSENTSATKKAASDTTELLDILNSFKGAFKVFNFIGKLAKPIGYIAFACSAIWGFVTAIKSGVSAK